MYLKLFLALTIFIICKVLTTSCKPFSKNCTFYDGQVNKTYHHDITQESPVFYIFSLAPYLIRDPSGISLRMEASAGRMANLDCPLLFTISQYQEVSNFQLPFSFRGSSDLHFTAGKTLCIPQNITSQARNITIRVSTCSLTRIYFDFKLGLTFDKLKTDGSITTTVITPTQATFYKYVFNPDPSDDTRIIKLTAFSHDTSCMTLSVQNLYCPVYDKETNVEAEGFWQTVTTKGAISISKKDFPEGFVVVLVLHHDNRRCLQGSTSMMKPSSSLPQTKTFIHAEWTKTINISLRKERGVPTGYFFLVIMIPVFCTILAVIGTCYLFQNRHNWLHKLASQTFIPNLNNKYEEENGLEMSTNKRLEEEAEVIRIEDHGEVFETDLDAVFNDELDDNVNNVESQEAEQEPMQRSQSFPSHLESQPDPSIATNNNPDTTNNTSVWRWKASLNITLLQRKDHTRLMKASNRFIWSVVIVSVFYTIPVYQLILHYIKVVNRTGEFDICYYNYLCAYRLWIFSDFNHFWSNISYILFGISFIIIVGRRERNLIYIKVANEDDSYEVQLEDEEENKQPLNSNSQTRKDQSDSSCSCFQKFNKICCCSCIWATKVHTRIDYGVPFHFGVFYAMGLALIMEGFLSAAYHLCPNQSNFQFDTCFMYVISVLTILKIYQFRHPIHLGANQTFGILALFVSVSVIGLILEVYDSSTTVLTIFRWCFYLCLLISLIYMSIHFYAIGYITNKEDGKVLGSVDVLTNINQLPHTVQIDRLILPIMSISLCIGVIIYAEVVKLHFATYLLYTLVSNVLASCIYYIGIMKPLHGEFKNWTWVQPLIYFTSSMVLGVIAMQYFLNVLTQWEVSPSASRAINEECTVNWFPFLPFYDNHDIWHFLSAGALFFAFMGLLIVDDDLLTTPQKNIPVF